jgi:hypothetical protein
VCDLIAVADQRFADEHGHDASSFERSEGDSGTMKGTISAAASKANENRAG